MGRRSSVVETVHNQSSARALAEAVFAQAFRDLKSRLPMIRDSAKAFLLAEDAGWRSARAFWATLANRDIESIEKKVRQQIKENRRIWGVAHVSDRIENRAIS